MFLKLLKYDFLDNYFPIVLINVLICISFALFIIFGNNGENHTVFEVILYGIIPILCLALVIFTLLAIVRTFDRKLFTNEAYLTFSLPISIDLILISKILIAFSWIIIDAISAILVFCMFDYKLPIEFFRDFFIYVTTEFGFLKVVLSISNAIVFPLNFVTTILFVLTLMSVFRVSRYRFFIGLVVYWVLSSIVGSIYSLFNSFFEYSSDYELLFFAVMQIIAIFVFYAIIRYLITKKLSF